MRDDYYQVRQLMINVLHDLIWDMSQENLTEGGWGGWTRKRKNKELDSLVIKRKDANFLASMYRKVEELALKGRFSFQDDWQKVIKVWKLGLGL